MVRQLKDLSNFIQIDDPQCPLSNKKYSGLHHVLFSNYSRNTQVHYNLATIVVAVGIILISTSNGWCSLGRGERNENAFETANRNEHSFGKERTCCKTSIKNVPSVSFVTSRPNRTRAFWTARNFPNETLGTISMLVYSVFAVSNAFPFRSPRPGSGYRNQGCSVTNWATSGRHLNGACFVSSNKNQNSHIHPFVIDFNWEFIWRWLSSRWCE